MRRQSVDGKSEGRRLLNVPGKSISVSPTVIPHGGKVQITITNDGTTVKPSNYDWIACYSPANSNITTTTPMRYQFANWTGTWGPGVPATTTLTFELNNVHYDYACYLFTGGLTKSPSLTLPFLAAEASNPQNTGASDFSKPFPSLVGGVAKFTVQAGPSSTITFTIPNLPTHVRVSPGANAAGVASLFFNFAWNQVQSTSVAPKAGLLTNLT